MPIDTYKSQRRGGKGITGMATREEDCVKEIFTASTHDTILFFSNKGKVYRLKGYKIPEFSRTAKGLPIVTCQYPVGSPLNNAAGACADPATPTFPPNKLPSASLTCSHLK